MKTTRKEAFLAGDKFYSPKKPCPQGHGSVYYTLSWRCVECSRLDTKKTRQALKASFGSQREVVE